MHVTSLFGLVFLRRTMSTQHWSRLVTLQVSTSGEQSVECISGGTWIPRPVELCDASSGYVACPVLFFQHA